METKCNYMSVLISTALILLTWPLNDLTNWGSSGVA